MVAEMLKHHLGTLVDANNYVPTTNTEKKKCNWEIMNRYLHQERYVPYQNALKNMDVVIVFESYPKSGNKQL
jgi:hypothetical protein